MVKVWPHFKDSRYGGGISLLYSTHAHEVISKCMKKTKHCFLCAKIVYDVRVNRELSL